MRPVPWFVRLYRRVSRHALPHPSVLPFLEPLEDRLDPSSLAEPGLLPDPPPLLGAAMAINFHIVPPPPLQTSTTDQTIRLNAGIQDLVTNQPIREGQVRFTVYSGPTSTGVPLGTAGPYGVDNQGNAGGSFTIPGGTPQGLYRIEAEYSDPSGTFASASASGFLILQPPIPPIGSWPKLTVTAVPDTLPSAGNPQSVTLGATAQDFSTGQPVTEGLIAFTVFNGPDSSSPVMGETSPAPVDAQGAVQVPFTLPAGTPPGRYMVLADYRDPGGSYSSCEKVTYLTIEPGRPINPSPENPESGTVAPPAPPAGQTPSPPAGGTPLAPLPVSSVVIPVDALQARPLAAPGTSPSVGLPGTTPALGGPTDPFAIAVNLAQLPPAAPLAREAVGGSNTPPPAATLPGTPVVLDVPAVPLFPLSPAPEGTIASVPEAPTTTALRLGTALTDTDDSAELFYSLERTGSGGGQTRLDRPMASPPRDAAQPAGLGEGVAASAGSPSSFAARLRAILAAVAAAAGGLLGIRLGPRKRTLPPNRPTVP